MATLSQLAVGQRSVITDFRVTDTLLLQRMKVLGFHVGAQVEVLHYGFPFRNPIAVRVGSHTIALGREEASLIEVEGNVREK